jgi:prevent-host-death family protein
MQVNVHEAKTNLSKLLNQVSEGQEIIIARSGKPVARLVAFKEKPTKRVPGSAKGKFVLTPDFNDPLPAEILAEFEA